MKQPSILVIGAGIAGLAAARSLQGQGFKITVLEARDRIGGRTWSDETLGFPFDYGAFIFHGTENNPVAQIAFDLNINMSLVDPFNKHFGNNQPSLSVAQAQTIATQFDELLVEAGNYARSQKEDMPLLEAMSHVFKNENYPALREDIYAWKHLFLTLYTGSDANDLSASHWNDSEIALGGNHPFVIGGYRAIVEHLAQGLTIVLNTTVTEIDYQQNEVVVKTHNEQYQADAVVVTLPLGVLKKQQVTFTPALPQAKQQAIAKLKMGVLNKIALKFDKIFWPQEAAVLTWLAKEYNSISWFINYYGYINQPVLVAAIAGDVAKKLENATDSDIIEAAMASLRKLYGDAIPSPTSYIITRWNQDPYTYGSYSYIPAGASGSDYDVLAQSVDNKLYFAGEATIKEYPGTVHGAYFSAMREVEKMIKQFGSK